MKRYVVEREVPGLSVAKRPPSKERVHLSCSLDEITALTRKLRHIPPA